MQLSIDSVKRFRNTSAALELAFTNWRPHFQEIADYLLPRRYEWLAAQSLLGSGSANAMIASMENNRAGKSRNRKILDPAGTKAARTLAAGMMNGITSPSRPWLRLRRGGFDEQSFEPIAHQAYFEEVARRMLLVMAESNFYNSMAILYLDLVGFGTAAMLIYEDFDEVIRCYNSPVGEFRLAQSNRRLVNTYARTITMTIAQAMAEFGKENLNEKHKGDIDAGGDRHQKSIVISHIIEENLETGKEYVNDGSAYREAYWETGVNDGSILRLSVYTEPPGLFPRYELTGNDTYGTCPGMDALPEIIQLQQAVLKKAQAKDKMVDPPVILEGFMRSNQNSLLPGGKSYAPANASFGAKAVYTVNPPLGEMTADENALRMRIESIFHNDLFRMISQLDTVRSATEIDARKEEKLVLMGAVLERFENEALDPAIRRIYGIMKRKGLLPEPPPGLEDTDVEVEYVSILSDAQKAVGTASIERFAQFIGELGATNPDILNIPDWQELVRDYGERLNVPAQGIKSREQVAQEQAQDAELNQAREAALVGNELTNAAKNLSETELGGGQSALDLMIAG